MPKKKLYNKKGQWTKYGAELSNEFKTLVAYFLKKHKDADTYQLRNELTQSLNNVLILEPILNNE